MPFVMRKNIIHTRELAEDLLRMTFDRGWRAHRGDIIEVKIIPSLDDHARRAVSEVYEFMNHTFTRRFRASFGQGAAGSAAAARYREVRGEGYTHEQAVEEMKAVVRWCKREWWRNPKMRGFCKPDTIFRKTKFHERRP
jgi:hypothetical protein